MNTDKMKTIKYKENNPIDIDVLTALYKSVGWTAYSDDSEIMEGILPGAHFYISAWSGEKLIGLIRTVGDGAYILYIQDILVYPGYQRSGIGSMLMKQTLKKAEKMKQIILTTDNTEKTKSFYRSLGFHTIEETGAVSFIKV